MKRISSWLEVTSANWKNVLKKSRRELHQLKKEAISKGFRKVPAWDLLSNLFLIFERFEQIIGQIESDHRDEVSRLKDRVKILEGRLKLDPENSHKPPSSRRHKKIKNLREKSGRKPGGQKGHEGVEMPLESEPDQVLRYEATRCRSCGRELKSVKDSEVVKHQVVDLKNGVQFVREYQRITKFCPDCGDMNRGDVPGEITLPRSRRTFGPNLKSVAIYFMTYQLVPVARTQEILADLFGVSLSQGTLCNFAKELGKRLWAWEVETKAQLLAAPVLNADESGLRCEKRNDWVHVHATENVTLLSHHRSRGSQANEEIGILPEYKGHLVHDGFKMYDQYNCAHSYCNAHILRELKYLAEEENEKWAHRFGSFLRETLHCLRSSAPVKKIIESKYLSILKSGFKECGLAKEFKGRPPDYYKYTYENGKSLKTGKFRRRALTRGQNLLVRLRDHMKEVLAFAFKPSVPFTNNQAERDLRMIRLKEKISGCFRSEELAKLFCRIRSFMHTMKKQQLPLLDNLVLVQVLDL